MRLMFVGDISLGEHFFSFGHGPRSVIEKGENIFQGVEHVLSRADFVVGNLEGPLSDIGYNAKEPLSRVFRGSPLSVNQLFDAGINVLSLANNHSLQHGRECFSETVSMLSEAGIQVIGLPRQLEPENSFVLHGKDGESVGLVAASDMQDNSCQNHNMYASADMDVLSRKVKELSQRCDCVIVFLHWGVEGAASSDEYQKQAAIRLIDAGADWIIGHHPHVFFEIERVKSGYAAYSLGNFVFDLPWDRKMKNSGILELDIKKNNQVPPIKVWPVELKPNGTPIASKQPETISTDTKKIYLYNYSCGLRKQALKKLAFFMLYLPKGDSVTKIRFLLWKLKTIMRQK